jgi:hypothetical protein
MLIFLINYFEFFGNNSAGTPTQALPLINPEWRNGTGSSNLHGAPI